MILDIIFALIVLIALLVYAWNIGYYKGYREGMNYVVETYLSDEEELMVKIPLDWEKIPNLENFEIIDDFHKTQRNLMDKYKSIIQVLKDGVYEWSDCDFIATATDYRLHNGILFIMDCVDSLITVHSISVNDVMNNQELLDKRLTKRIKLYHFLNNEFEYDLFIKEARSDLTIIECNGNVELFFDEGCKTEYMHPEQLYNSCGDNYSDIWNKFIKKEKKDEREQKKP